MKRETLKRFNAMLAGLIGGLSLGILLRARATPTPLKVPDVIRAQCFELLDQTDKVRARLRTDAKEKTSLILYDKSGDERATLSCEEAKEEHGHVNDSSTVLSLYNHKKNMNMHLLVSDDGDGLLTFGSVQKSKAGQSIEKYFAELKVSSLRDGVRLRLSARGDGLAWQTPAKGEASVELVGDKRSIFLNPEVPETFPK